MKPVLNINGIKYDLSYNIRAIIIFERISGKPFEIRGMTDWVMLAYACLLSANTECDLPVNEFIDSIEEKELESVIIWLTKLMQGNNQLSEDNTGSKKKSRGVKSTG